MSTNTYTAFGSLYKRVETLETLTPPTNQVSYDIDTFIPKTVLESLTLAQDETLRVFLESTVTTAKETVNYTVPLTLREGQILRVFHGGVSGSPYYEIIATFPGNSTQTITIYPQEAYSLVYSTGKFIVIPGIVNVKPQATT